MILRYAFLLTAVLAAPGFAQTAPNAFGICGVCHRVTPDGKNGLGPNLRGVAGRTSGTVPGFAYSPALKAAKIKWTRASLLAFIAAPQAKVPGTRMAYAGQKNAADAAAIADYLVALH